MAAHDIVMSAAGGSAAATYIEDVFSTYLYTGNGSTQTITNGIDLAGKGGAVFTRCRSNAETNQPTYDTARGVGNWVATYSTAAQTFSSGGLTSFNADGFTIGSSFQTNGRTYTSWTFRKQPKFFDVVTYTGDGTSNRQIAHALGSVPGCIIIKCTSQVTDWKVYHVSVGAGSDLQLNNTFAAAANGIFPSTPTSTVFTIAQYGSVNQSGQTYVAYIFAHNAGGFGLTGTDNVISCGSFTTDSSGNFTTTLGYEPQWILYKNSGATSNWNLIDNMRGWPIGAGSSYLRPNTSAAETTDSLPYMIPMATGFAGINGGFGNTQTYIYIAIRRGPMKVPTSGTSVFSPATYTGNGGTTLTGSVLTDLFINKNRSGTSGDANSYFVDRLRGGTQILFGNTTDPEYSTWTDTFDQMTGVSVGSTSGNRNLELYVGYNVRRAPGFFDEVCYTGTGSIQTVNHNLGVPPELVIVKPRQSVSASTGSYGSTGDWWVWSKTLSDTIGANTMLQLNTSNAVYNAGGSIGPITNVTSTTFRVIYDSFGPPQVTAASGVGYVALLFATCPGVSKVGSYSGTGAAQTIACGFAAGARFVLIKRSDSTGDWYLWDSARGIISGNDPYLLLNSAVAEVTTTDYISPQSVGFGLTASAPAALNASGGTYQFLAIA